MILIDVTLECNMTSIGIVRPSLVTFVHFFFGDTISYFCVCGWGNCNCIVIIA